MLSPNETETDQRAALDDFAAASVQLFWHRQVTLLGCTLTCLVYAGSWAVLVIGGLCHVLEYLELHHSREARKATSLPHRDVTRLTSALTSNAIGSALTIAAYAGYIASIEPPGVHLLPLMILFAAAIYGAMFNHPLRPVLIARMSIYGAAFLGIASIAVLRSAPDVPQTVYFQFVTAAFGAYFLLWNAHAFRQTYRLRAEQRAMAQKQSARFEDFATLASDWMWETDADHRLIYCTDPPFADATAEACLGQDLRTFEFGVFNSTDALRAKLVKAMARPSAFREITISGPRAGKGGDLTLMISGQPTFDEAGTFQGYRGTVQDVTSLVQSQLQLRELEAHLGHSQRLNALGELTSGISHDFNNLLSVVLGNVEVALQGNLPPEERRLIEEVRGAVERGQNLTSSLTTMARRANLQPKPLDLSVFVAAATQMISRTFPKSIAVEVAVSPDLPPSAATVIEVDASMLENALVNLAFNARDAMPDGGRLVFEIGTTAPNEEGSGPLFSVTARDTGQGMPPDVLARATDPYFTTKEFKRGSGLGLAVVNGFVAQSGGEMTIESTEGAGTAVRLSFPAAEKRPSPIRRNAPLVPAPRNTLILVVEDDPHVARAIGLQLEKLGYQVDTAEDAEVALAKLGSGLAPALVITDVDMPGEIQGDALAEALLATYPQLPVVIMSGYPMDPALGHHPLRKTLQKPFSIAGLAAALQDFSMPAETARPAKPYVRVVS